MQTQATFPRWVDVLFSRLHVRYGDAWLRKWDGINPDAIKADWQEQLANIFARNPKSIAYALEHLPADFPPNSDQFLKLCLQKPAEHVALPAPVSKPDPAFAAEVMKRLQAAKPQQSVSPGEECARRLEALQAAGGVLSPSQRAQLDAIRGLGIKRPEARAMTAEQVQERKDEIARQVAEYTAARGLAA